MLNARDQWVYQNLQTFSLPLIYKFAHVFLKTSHSAHHHASCLTLPASLTPVVVVAAEAAASAMRELLDPFQNELFSRK